MWKIPAIVFAVGWIGSILVISMLRPIVHARRQRTRGIGGTQDIAMYGTLFGLVCMIGTGICYYLWLTGK